MATVIKRPAVDSQILSANTTIDNTEQRILLIGQKVSAGSATAGTLVTDIQNDGSWDTIFGSHSMLAAMARNVRRYNQRTRMDAICLADNGSGVAASGTIAVTGPATETGSLTVVVGSYVDNKYTITVTSGDNATTIGEAIEAAVNADDKSPVTANNVTGTVTFTAANDGTPGNSIPIYVTGTVAGVGYTITGMASGATDSSFTGIFDLIANSRYQTIVWPYQANIGAVADELDTRWSAPFSVLDGVAIVGATESYANMSSLGAAENSQSVVIVAQEKMAVAGRLAGPCMREIPYNWASMIAGIRALRLTDGASISRFIISRDGSLDRWGGMHLASLPYFNTPVPALEPMNVADGFTNDEAANLEDDGVSVVGNNSTGTAVILGSMVTTYKTDSAGNPDTSFKYLNYVDTSSGIREYYYNNLRARFAQCRLVEGALVPGFAMANGPLIESYVMSLYQDLADLALVQAGEEAEQFVKDNLTVTLDLEEGSVTISMIAPIVTQLRTIYQTIQVGFTTEG